jgi:hypothetical protein
LVLSVLLDILIISAYQTGRKKGRDKGKQIFGGPVRTAGKQSPMIFIELFIFRDSLKARFHKKNGK